MKKSVSSKHHFVYLIVVMTAVLFLGACATAQKPPGASAASKQMPPRPNLHTLSLGNPELKDKFVEIGLGDIVRTSDGARIDFETLIQELAQPRVVYLGESHTSLSIHQFQTRVIKSLYNLQPSLKIGMEFFQRDSDKALKLWSNGWLTEKGLMYMTGWYKTGGYNFAYYRPFMNFAREKGLPVIGLNIPRTVLRSISTRGLDALNDDEKKMVGAVDVNNKEHRELIMQYFGGASMAHGGGGKKAAEARMDRMYAAQSTWDNVFADSALAALEDWDGILVVIVGSGHVSYNLGTNRRFVEKSDLPTATIMPIHVDGKKERVRVVRSIGDYIVGVEADMNPEHFPRFGISGTDKDGKIVVGMLFPNSLASKAGLKTGDIITALDGKKLKDATEMRMRLAIKTWGDSAQLTVNRDGKSEEITIKAEK